MKEGLKIGTEMVTDKIKAIDRYSRAITFTYKNKDSFGTTFGRFVIIRIKYKRLINRFKKIKL